MMKAIGNILVGLSCVFLLWMLVSFIDVNLHNGLNLDGTPQGGTQWQYNAFVIMCEQAEGRN